MRPRVYKSRRRGIYASLAYMILGFCAALILLMQSADPWAMDLHLLLIVVILPPCWIIAEHLFLFDNWKDERAIKEFKYGQTLAGKLWICLVVVVMLIIVFR